MNRKEAAQILAILKAAYPGSYNGMTQKEAAGTVSVWAMQFAEVPANIVGLALQKCISVSKFPPTIREVKDKIQSLHWEAYEAMENQYLDPEARKQCQWIYEVTREYRNMKTYEPTLPQMITGGQMLQIGTGE